MSWRIETLDGEVKMTVTSLKEAKKIAEDLYKGEEVHFNDWKGETAVYITSDKIKVLRILQENEVSL